MKIRNVGSDQEVELMMTPMIDIVFQLLAFFIITFKVVAMEGDFQITMPLASDSDVVDMDLEPDPIITVTLWAKSNGTIDDIDVNGTHRFGEDFQALSEFIKNYLNDPNAGSFDDNTKVEFICKEPLKYGEFVNAMTAVTGYRLDDKIIPLIENIEIKDE